MIWLDMRLMIGVCMGLSLFWVSEQGLAQAAANSPLDSESQQNLSAGLGVDIPRVLPQAGEIRRINHASAEIVIDDATYRLAPSALAPTDQSDQGQRYLQADQLEVGMSIEYQTDGTAASAGHLPYVLRIWLP